MDGTRQRKAIGGEKKKEKKKNKVEEIQLANFASLGSLASNELAIFTRCISFTGSLRAKKLRLQEHSVLKRSAM